MDIGSTPFIRNDYWPSYNELNEISQRIDNVESDVALNTASLQLSINNVSDNLNAYEVSQADTSISNNIIVNDINANYAHGKYGNFQNISSDNIVTNNLQVTMPVVGVTLTDAAIINPHISGGNINNADITNANFGQFVEFNDVNVKNLNISDGLQVDDIYSSNVNSVNVNASFGNINNLKSNDIDIVNASIDNASISAADIVSLNVTSSVIGNITSDNIVVNNVDVFDAKAESLLVNDFNAPVNAFIENLAFNTINGSGINALGVNAHIISANHVVTNQSDFADANVDNLHVNNALFENIKININEAPVQTSAILGYDINGRIIPVGAPTYTPDLPNNADYILTDEYGSSFAGQADTVVTVGSTNLVTSGAVYNSISDINNNMNNNINIVNENIYSSIANNNADVALKSFYKHGILGSSYEKWPYFGKTPTGNLYFTSNFELISELNDVSHNIGSLTTFGTKDGDGYAIGVGWLFMGHGDVNGVDGVNNIIIMKDQQFSEHYLEIDATNSANDYSSVNGKNVYIEEWKPGFVYDIVAAKSLYTPFGTFEASGYYSNYRFMPSLCGTSMFECEGTLKGDLAFNTNKWGSIMYLTLFAANNTNVQVDDFKYLYDSISIFDGQLSINNVDTLRCNIQTNVNASVDININKMENILFANIGVGTSMHLELNDSPLVRLTLSASNDAQGNSNFTDHEIYINGFNCLNIGRDNNSNYCYLLNSYDGQIMNNVNIYLRPSDNFVTTADMPNYAIFKSFPAGQINIHIPSTFDNTTDFYNWCNQASAYAVLYNDL